MMLTGDQSYNPSNLSDLESGGLHAVSKSQAVTCSYGFNLGQITVSHI